MKPTCSIVIRAYNEADHIGRLLTGVQQQSITDCQVILVDSGSSDHTVSIARSFGAEVVQIPPKEFTFGRSLNCGIQHASAPLVVIASAHVYPVYPDWLERLLERFKDPRVALAYGKQRGAAGTHFSEHQIFQQWFPDQSHPGQPYPFCNNANAAIRRELWEQHAYDEKLPGLEDLAWAKWAQDHGQAIDYVAEAEVVHVHQETTHGIYNRYRREGMAFKSIYPQENFRRRDLLRLWSSNVASDWRAARQQGVFRQVWWKVVSFRWQQFYGTYQGYRQSGPLTWQLKRAFYYPRVNELDRSEAIDRDVAPIEYADVPPAFQRPQENNHRNGG